MRTDKRKSSQIRDRKDGYEEGNKHERNKQTIKRDIERENNKQSKKKKERQTDSSRKKRTT